MSVKVQWLIAASMIFLAEPYPEWMDLTDDEADDWVKAHVWEPFENWQIKDIQEQIYQLAILLQGAYEQGQKSVLKGMH
jgi:hypothetical protein